MVAMTDVARPAGDRRGFSRRRCLCRRNHEPLPVIAAVLAAVRDQLSGLWLALFFTVSSGRLGGERPSTSSIPTRSSSSRPPGASSARSSVSGGETSADTRASVGRQRQARVLFTVTSPDGTVVPGFQLDAAGRCRPELRPVFDVLLAGGPDGSSRLRRPDFGAPSSVTGYSRPLRRNSRYSPRQTATMTPMTRK